MDSKKRLLVVSNRLPISIKHCCPAAARNAADTVAPVYDCPDHPSEESRYVIARSSGGLVSALAGVQKGGLSFTWVGWPGQEIPEPHQPLISRLLQENHMAHPVFISEQVGEMHYNGFSNSILWPLFHYLPGDIAFNEEHWVAYQRANETFADAIMPLLRDGDIVWVHDYHLMLLPALLRRKIISSQRPLSSVKIGFFLHTPFPSSEIYRILPVRHELLIGVLHADLVGFHTYDYARHFLSSCTRLLGLRTGASGVEFEGRNITVGAYPIGIDPDRFLLNLLKPTVQERINSLRTKFHGVKIVLGVDRLDYIKGVPLKLHAFETFLSQYPEFLAKVVLVQVAVPSRTDVNEYQELRQLVNEHVGRLNGRFGSVDFTPVHFLNQSVEFDELCALYAVADACIVTSTRDGMNLVSYEYVACQKETHGTLLLSEFAGAAQSLNGSLIFNPWNVEEVVRCIHDALVMAPERRARNHNMLFRYVQKFTAANWGLSFFSELCNICDEFGVKMLHLPELTAQDLFPLFFPDQEKSSVDCPIGDAASTNLVDSSLTSSRELVCTLPPERFRVIFIDYDGTITSFHARPDYARPSPRILGILDTLVQLPNTYVYILSGRTRQSLESWFSNTMLGLVAENGCFYRHPESAIQNCSYLQPVYQAIKGSLLSEFSKATDPDSLKESRTDATSKTTESKSPSDEIIAAPVIVPVPLESCGWYRLGDPFEEDWRKNILSLFNYYTKRTPGSFVEQKEINITWHYRNSDPEFAAWQVGELQVNVEKLLAHLPVSVITGGNCTLEISRASIDKSATIKTVLRDLMAGSQVPSAVVCFGNNLTDESMFSFLENNKPSPECEIVTVTVGKKRTHANHYVESFSRALGILEALSRCLVDGHSLKNMGVSKVVTGGASATPGHPLAPEVAAPAEDSRQSDCDGLSSPPV